MFAAGLLSADDRSAGVSITVGEPVVVARAPADLNRAGGGWGRWQFPTISRLADGQLLVTYSLEPDSYASYGKPVGSAYSSDDGKTWQTGEAKSRSQVEQGVLLPNGDRLKPVELTSLPAGDYKLPASVCNFVCSYGYPRSLYRADQLPREFRGWRFSRLPKESNEWIEETAAVHIPDELLHVTAENVRAKPGVGQTDAVIAGPISRPYLWGKMRIASDRSLWGAAYIWRMHGDRPRYSPIFLRSIDNGRTWTLAGEIPYRPKTDVDARAEARDGFTEPDYSFRPDGSLICLMRTMDGNGPGPLFLTRSADFGKTWSPPVGFDSFGKTPQLLTLNNGVTVATYGASGGPGFFVVRATTDPDGLKWVPRITTAHSRPVPNSWDTCGHTELVPLDDNSALMVYSDFNYLDENNVPRKTILVRRVHVDADENE